MFLQYTKIFPVTKQEILDLLIKIDVEPRRIVNGLAGSSMEWASYHLYNEGFYEADIGMTPMLGETTHTINLVYHDYKAFKKLDAFFIGMGFEKNETFNMRSK
jgi:hypothetical protein